MFLRLGCGYFYLVGLFWRAFLAPIPRSSPSVIAVVCAEVSCFNDSPLWYPNLGRGRERDHRTPVGYVPDNSGPVLVNPSLVIAFGLRDCRTKYGEEV